MYGRVAAARCEHPPQAASPHGILHVHVPANRRALRHLFCAGQDSQEAADRFHLLLSGRI
jgi:hypothetical protein